MILVNHAGWEERARGRLPVGSALLLCWAILAMPVLEACAAKGSFEADRGECRSQASTTAPLATPDEFRFPRAVNDTAGARVPSPPPGETSAYSLCMRSRGWKLDEDGRAVDKGLSANEYSQRVGADLMVCVHGSGDKPAVEASAEASSASSASRAVCACLERAATSGITSVDLSLVVGEGGEVRRVTAQPESPVAACLRESLPETAVAQPPSAPWKISVRILHYQ